jgi:acyl carrier protein
VLWALWHIQSQKPIGSFADTLYFCGRDQLQLCYQSDLAMTPETDPKKIALQLCQFARTNFVAEGQDFDENSPLSQAGIDSFALVELLLFCERVIGVQVPDSHLTGTNLASMTALANCIAELARNGQSAS